MKTLNSLAVMAALLLAGSLSGCLDSDKKPMQSENAKPEAAAPAPASDIPGLNSRFKGTPADTVLRMSINSPASDNREWRAAAAFRDYVESQTNGKVQIQIYPSGQLGSERVAFEAVAAGDLDMSTAADGPIAGFVPAVGVISIPYLFSAGPVAWEVLDSPFGQRLKAEVEQVTGNVVLGLGEDGFRSFLTKGKQIKTLDDLKGVKIRVMENQVYLKMMQAVGANPVPMAGGDELYNAMEQGVVDGFENAPDVMYSFKFYEVADYLTVDAHTFGSTWLTMSRKAYDALSDEHKFVIRMGAHIWQGMMRAPKENAATRAAAQMGDKVREVYFMPQAEIARLKDAAQPAVIEFMRASVGDSWVDLILEETRKAEVRLLAR